MDDPYVLISEPQRIVRLLKDDPPASRKTKYSALVVLCGQDSDEACEVYRQKMMDDSEIVRHNEKAQKKTDKQTEAWMDWDDIIKRADEVGRVAKQVMKKQRLNKDDWKALESYLITLLYTSQEPRRLLDWVQMRIKGDAMEDENYIEKNNTWVFRNYKTRSHYGTQKMPISKKLKTFLKYWKSITPDTHVMLLHDSNGNPMNVQQLNSRINKIWEKDGLGANGLRHSYLTWVYKDMEPLAEMEERARRMGHSFEEALTYIKRD